MNENCGCCEGVENLTPMDIANRPGLNALHYRVGTHGSFLEKMKARLSNMGITNVDLGLPPGNPGGQERPNYPLQGLSTRTADDPAIAMLDAWATVADVLTFYQERIANEGYLLTATERRSILELARLVGYALRPGVAASVYLAYTLEDGAEPTTIMPGNRAQSLPGPGELPQSFETSEKLEARTAWNNLKPRQSRPQFITQNNADIIDTLYFQGVATNLKPNDPLLLVIRDLPPQPQFLRFVKEVEPQNVQNRTKVTLHANLIGGEDKVLERVVRQVKQTIERYLDLKTFCVAPKDGLLELFKEFQDQQSWKLTYLQDRLINLLKNLQGMLSEATNIGDALLATWLGALFADLLMVLTMLTWYGEVKTTFSVGAYHITEQWRPRLFIEQGLVKISPAKSSISRTLASLIAPLLKPATPQVANGLRLKRDLKQEFVVGSDLHPQILTILQPSLKTKLYPALATAKVTGLSELESAQAFRVKAAPFGNNAPRKPIYNEQGIIIDHEEWPLVDPVTLGLKLIVVAGGPEQIQVSVKQGQETWERVDQLSSIWETQNHTLTYLLSDITVNILGTFAEEQHLKITITFELPSKEEVVIKLQQMAMQQGKPMWSVQVNTDKEHTVELGQLQIYSKDKHHVEIVYDGTVLSVKDELFVASPVAPAPYRRIVALDALYEQITPGSWVVVEYPDGRSPLITRVKGTRSFSKADYGITGKVTELTLDDVWLYDDDLLLSSLRGVTIYAQSTPRDLTDEPIDPVKESVCGDEIELDALYDGLQSGRWVIVTGERTDMLGVSGVIRHGTGYAGKGDTGRTQGKGF